MSDALTFGVGFALGCATPPAVLGWFFWRNVARYNREWNRKLPQ